MQPDLLIAHLEGARDQLILAYNTAKNAGLEDSKTAIAWALADVSAELQSHTEVKVGNGNITGQAGRIG